MKNMNRMKSCVRPAMCKPYGKQSEALQKSEILIIYIRINTGWSTNDATRSVKYACDRKNLFEFLLHQKFELTPFIRDTTLDTVYQVGKDPFQHGLRDFFDDLRDIGFQFAQMIDVHFLFDVASQEEVIRCQIRWPGWPQTAGNEAIIEEGT